MKHWYYYIDYFSNFIVLPCIWKGRSEVEREDGGSMGWERRIEKG